MFANQDYIHLNLLGKTIGIIGIDYGRCNGIASCVFVDTKLIIALSIGLMVFVTT